MVLAAQLLVCVVNIGGRITAGTAVHKFLYFAGKATVLTGMLCLFIHSGYIGIFHAGIEGFLCMEQFPLPEILFAAADTTVHILLTGSVCGPVSQGAIDDVSSLDIDAAFCKPAHLKCFGYECHCFRVLSVIVVIIVVIVIIVVGRGTTAATGA